MSYPAEIRTLIIEDDPYMVEEYRRIFDYLRGRDFPLLSEPSFAESYEDASAKLLGPNIYHLVILDLALPETTGGPLGDVMARGLGLIPQIAAREDYPVPILMIVTADPARVVNAPLLEQQLRDAFWKHWVIPKNDKLPEQLVPGIEAAIQYSRIGIHLIGDETSGELWPMLSPREEDILRRSILMSGASAVGADLRWWSVERDALRTGDPCWSKVLRGKMILSGESGYSRERFLKFVSKDEGEVARQSAELLASKLPYGHLIRYTAVGSRALLVTDKAGPSDASPRALRVILKTSELLTDDEIARLADDIIEQLTKLGEPSSSNTMIRRMLWPHHDDDRLVDSWSRIPSGTDVEPVSILRELRDLSDMLVISWRVCHGDLHPGNISVNEDDSKLRAYLIDAGAMKPDVWGKDIAVLEVSILLHVDFETGMNPIASLPSLFDGSDPYGERIDWKTVDVRIRNAGRMIVSLRNRIRATCPEKAYVVLLIDYVLVQIGGVVFGTTYNKIISLNNVAALFYAVVEWYRKQYPSS